jgi:NADP-dependent 3-hydroxy acid dehydrogenase YdfG
MKVLIAGASSGIGEAAARQFLAKGVEVVVSARRLDRLQAIKGATPMACDVTDRAQVEQLIAAAWPFDALVFATGDNIPNRALARLSPERWDFMLDVNLTGAFNVTHAALPRMRAAGGGLLLYVSSISGKYGDASGAAYQASKRGLLGLAAAVRFEEKNNGIRTTVICPGVVKTGFIGKRPAPTPQEILDHALEPEDVAQAIVAVTELPARACVTELEIVPTRP